MISEREIRLEREPRMYRQLVASIGYLLTVDWELQYIRLVRL